MLNTAVSLLHHWIISVMYGNKKYMNWEKLANHFRIAMLWDLKVYTNFIVCFSYEEGLSVVVGTNVVSYKC